MFQDLALAPNRDVVANLFLGREAVRAGLLKPLGVLDRARHEATGRRSSSATLGVNIPRLTGIPIAHLSGGQRQAVAVARAAFWATRAMLMDEPTAALGVRESMQVLKLARSVADRGLAVVLISHILPHVMELADRVFVMRHGRCVAELTEDISSERLVRLIVGVDAEDVVGPLRGDDEPETLASSVHGRGQVDHRPCHEPAGAARREEREARDLLRRRGRAAKRVHRLHALRRTLRSAGSARRISDSIAGGESEKTRIPCAPYSRATAFVSTIRPAFVIP